MFQARQSALTNGCALIRTARPLWCPVIQWGHVCLLAGPRYVDQANWLGLHAGVLVIACPDLANLAVY